MNWPRPLLSKYGAFNGRIHVFNKTFHAGIVGNLGKWYKISVICRAF